MEEPSCQPTLSYAWVIATSPLPPCPFSSLPLPLPVRPFSLT